MTAKYMLNRAGLFNFWYYDNEIFEFADGKLLLRGTNGSGKSVTMQSLLPVLLDGKKTPDRLDPFGSRSRRMTDYLLGEKEVSDRDERTGYLFIEYKMKGSDQYLTTGMGMQAKRNQTLKSWGFVITDNRRIGHDFELFKLVNQNGEKKQFPYSQTELTTAIGSGGEVVSSNQDYMKLVNRYVFGFETLEAYDDLIKLLIQLRSPKLSKDFKPTVIYEILEEALPPLTDDDLRYLSDSIEQMDQTKQQMEQLVREVKALTKLKNAYEAYSERVFADQVKEWNQAKNRSEKEMREVEALEKELDKLAADFENSITREQELKIEEGALEEHKKRLQLHEVFQLEEMLQQKQNEQRELGRDLIMKGNQVDEKLKKEKETHKRIDELELKIDQKKQQLNNEIEELDFEAQESGFAQHELNLRDYKRYEGKSFDFDNWKRELEDHTTKLDAALQELRNRDSIIQQIEEKHRMLSGEKQAYDSLLDDERKWQTLLHEEKQSLIRKIHNWLENNQQYQVIDTDIQRMMRMVEQLFAEYEYEDIKELFKHTANNYEDGLRIRRAEILTQKAQSEKELEQLQVEWKKIQAQRDPEPKRHVATIKARNRLDEQAVAYKPLYEIVEFHPDIPLEVQRRLESALSETGLLDALVTTEQIEYEHDRVLIADPKLFTATLADYLQPDAMQKTIPYDRIEAILQSIEMNGEAPIHFTEDGRYRFGNLQGHALPLEEVRFIGREARRRYREQLLAEFEQQIADYQAQISLLEEERHRIDELFERSKEAWSDFPTSKDVKACNNELEETKRRLAHHNKIIKELSDQTATLEQKLQNSKRKINELTQGLALGKLTVECYQQALGQSRQYEKRLQHIHREHESWVRLLEEIRREEDRLDEHQFEVDRLRGEWNVLDGKAMKLQQEIDHIKQQQQLKGADDVRREIRETIMQLEQVTSELRQLTSRIPTLDVQRSNKKDKLVEKKNEYIFWSQMKVIWEETLQKEWKRGTFASDNEVLDEKHLKEFADKPLAKEKSVLEGELSKLFFSLQPDLTEHKITQFTDAPNAYDWMKEIDRDEWKPVIEQWKAKNTRDIIEFDQRGVKISPAALYESVARELSIQETRLDEMDKQLYEEILLNSVGHKLRARIRRAEQWTEKMRGLMESRDTSSGLKFSIRWKARTADSEQELDTSELVALLKQDSNLLNEDDLERITRHFRSKIQSAKAWLEEKGEGESLLQVLKMVLDYRKWFSFVLYYERPNEPRRELTNHQFFKFSGGEKAMAMYIPLFTACYSRYQEAAPSAPYIISLDEAFAGVDENNINEMFEIVEHLDFNYIMNSQVLWGDYETVQSLAVCELVRPKNADYVTVIRYTWNGQKLSMKVDEVGE
ncbi:TIGR02680 family protein [Paenibacillus sp. FSL W7-1287]|uniref:TIGR02680 family protein n=1 Tax=Paenibacillus sp. FSL W7-1287 TaxID=2954538 RepID=UPI0030FC0C19